MTEPARMAECTHGFASFDELVACETCGEAMCFECSRYNNHKHYRDVHKWCKREEEDSHDR